MKNASEKQHASMSSRMGVVESTAAADSRSFDSSSVFVRDRKKLKMTGFATLRKKLIRKRRSSKASDHGRVIRELIADWTPLEVSALLEEYEALQALKDLSVQAELARPPAATYKQDLATLYELKYCTDIDLIFRGTCFPIHRAILSARCPFFRNLLSEYPGHGSQIRFDLTTPGVDMSVFAALLRILYTGDIGPRDSNINLSALKQVADELITPNTLEQDLRYLLETGDYADASLVFTSDSSTEDYRRPDSGCSEYGFRPKLDLPCHKAILSARSPFFRNLIQRRSRLGEEHSERSYHVPTRIVLDESVIPKRYAKVLLHAIYLDHVDLGLILRGNGCGSNLGSLGEVEALTHTGRIRPSALEEAMELYQIGRFLELDIVAQGCEDLILEHLTLDSLPTVLRWGSQPHGSPWVGRQARHFLREEFSQVANSPVLFQLDKKHLIEALQSDFLLASELDVLSAVLKWGENQLVRRIEDREPNLVSQTAHSVSRKGIKKRDLNDVELRELLSELLPLVRMDHVIPQNSDILCQAIRRGLVSTPPSHMMGNDNRDLLPRVNAWVRTPNALGLFVRPRLFQPYYDEIKALLEDQMVQELDLMRYRRTCYVADIPDTLYMIDKKSRSHPNPTTSLPPSVPIPDTATLNAMLKREQKLRASPYCQRAQSLPLSSHHNINRQIRLRVVREFNLPDSIADILENAVCYCTEVEEEEEEGAVMSSQSCGRYASNSKTLSRNKKTCLNELPAIITEQDFHRQPECESSSCSDGHLSEILPDVAMATSINQISSSLNQVSVNQAEMLPPELELDLGNGTVPPFRRSNHATFYPPPHRFI
uniref:BTB/POZ domain-containing protein 7 n=1 Tax=Cacopsylla melanoneura TaxID=428564 RepID=A0A8D9ACE9_9HEMI